MYNQIMKKLYISLIVLFIIFSVTNIRAEQDSVEIRCWIEMLDDGSLEEVCVETQDEVMPPRRVGAKDCTNCWLP